MCFARSQAEWLKGRKVNAALSAMSDSFGDDEAVHVFERYSDSAADSVALTCTKTHDASGRPPGTQLES